MTTLALEAFNLSVKYQNRLLFDIPYLKILAGDSIYLQGKNGIGKTSLLKILAGLQKPTTGILSLNHPSILQRISGFTGQSNIIYLHQQPYLFDGNIIDNISYGLKRKKIDKKNQKKIILKALEETNLLPLAEQHISCLSSGEKQKVAIARAWVLKPKILLMDESCANLDIESIHVQKKMVDLLLNEGASLVITSHHPNLLTEQCGIQWNLINKNISINC